MQPHQVADSSVSCIDQKIIKSPFPSRCVDPFLQRASRKIAVVVDYRSPSRHHVDAGKPIPCYGGVQRPEAVLSVQKQWPRVISYDIYNPIIFPGLQCVRIVQPSDGWGNNTIGAEALSSIKTNLPEPSLVE